MATATSNASVTFPWSDAYSVGIPQIDTQHKGLIRLINELHTAMAAGQGKQVLGKILDELVRYTEIHFTYEENMLRQGGYSKLAAHNSAHQKLTRQVMELRDKYRASKLTLTLEVMQFLKSWLGDHILIHDQAYARELKRRE
jgi:hemerythrin